MDTDHQIDELPFAFGPTWTPSQGLSIYGGPFVHFVRGQNAFRIEGDDEWKQHDIEEDSIFGGYVGAQVQLGENACVNVEWMTTGDADALGAGVICKF